MRLDVFAKDSTGKRYNIEVQCEDKGASVRRARYNGSLLDAGVTNPGDGYEDLPDVYIIFITRHDVLGKGLPIYHIDRMIEETKEKVEDGSHIIYVTSDYAAETPLGMLMADFNNPDPHTMNYGILKDKAVCLKETEEGAEQIMCKISEELVEYGMKKGMERGFITVAMEMIKERTPIGMIQKFTKLSLEQLQELSKQTGVALVMP